MNKTNISIKLLSKILSAVFLLLLFSGKANAFTFDWKGTSSTAWTTSTNWTKSGSGGTSTYPGQSGSVDIVKIGVTPYTSNQPTLGASVTVASLEFGDNSGNSMTLTVSTGFTLTVAGAVKQDHNNSTGGITTTISGGGALVCSSFTVGDNTAPPAPSGEVLFGDGPQTFVTTLNSAIASLKINGNLTLNTTSSLGGSCTALFFPFTGYSVNNVAFNLNFGTLDVNNIITTNSNYVSQFLLATNAATFSMDNSTSANTLDLFGANPITLATGGVVDFVSGGTLANSAVNYEATSGTQTVYSSGDSGIGTSPTVYANLNFSNASIKKVDAGTLTVGGNLTTGNGAIDLTTNSAVVTVAGAWTNSSNVTQGFGNISVTGNYINSGNLTLGTGSFTLSGNYTNSGSYTQSTGNTVFNGTNQVLTDSGFGTMFNNVIFNGNGGSGNPAKISSGNFSVSTTGTLTMANSTYLNANGHLTLNSDANSSASVAAIPAGAGITGNVSVQRFIKGSSTDATKRGYRAISSTIYTATVGGVNVFDLKYLLNSALISGVSGGGFNVTTSNNNASIYLFREDDPPPPSNSTPFTTLYNWKGIAKINNTNAYDIGTQKRLTTTNIADTTTTIPVGNGVLFFFRGNTTLSNGTTSGNKTTAPFNYPEDVTTTQLGSLNTGTINVKLWFANAANNLGTKLSYTSVYASSGSSSLRGGYTFVGNPYASTINWEKYNRNGTNSSIYGAGALGSTIWIFNEFNGQYESYQQKATTITSADTTTNINPGTAQGSASNMIASGQGFFIKATVANSQSLSFRETAKTSTQPSAANLHNLMGAPKEFVLQPEPLFRLKLIKDTVNTDEIVIRMNNQASTKYVENEDAEDLGGSGALESLSALSSDSVVLAIDYMPFPGKQSEIVPLLVDATASGTYKLDNTQLDNLQPIYQIWLKDAFTHDSLLMKTGATYSFTIDKTNAATFGTKRFTVVIGQDTALMYKLLNFTATKVSAATPQVQLAWTTKNEQNYTNFTVERSTDGGKTFAVIGGLAGTGAGNYSLPDKSPIIGTNLYRLKQEDMNDSITYSKIVSIQYNTSNTIASKLSIYPNPVTSIINVSISDDAAVKPPYTIQITNTSGFVIRQVTSSQQKWETNVADLMPGTYIVKVHNSKDNTIIGDTKFVKL